MHDLEIERRLRLPAPEEPAVLAALVLPAEMVVDSSGAVEAAPVAYAVLGRTRVRPIGAARSAVIAAGIVLAIALAAILRPAGVEVGGPASPALTSSSPPSPASSGSQPSGAVDGPIVPGRFELPWPLAPEGAQIHVTVPSGWASIGNGLMTIYRDAGKFYDFPVAVSAHTVTRVVTSMCAEQNASEIGPTVASVGPTIDDLATAIAGIDGTRWSEPEGVTVGGYPAKRLTTTYDASTCEGPLRRTIWADDRGGSYFVEDGMTSTVLIVDVDGHRLVIATEARDASADDRAQLDAVVASIQIDPPVAGPVPTSSLPSDDSDRFPMAVGPDAALRVGPHEAIVEGVPFEFDVPSPGWEPQRQFYVSKSFIGSQAAEAIIRWSTYPDGRHTDPCPGILSVGTRPTPEQLAAAIASAPGIERQVGPSATIVGGRVAQHVVVRVVTDAGCDPGYFYAYEPVDGGALWTETRPGDTIMVWIVDVGGRLVLIEAQHRGDLPLIEEEIHQIVDSVRFG